MNLALVIDQLVEDLVVVVGTFEPEADKPHGDRGRDLETGIILDQGFELMR